MPAKSKSQQRFFGMVDAYKKGELKNASKKIKDAAKGMSKKEVKKFASTKTKGLPEKVDENKVTVNESQLRSLVKEAVHDMLCELDWKTYANAARKRASQYSEDKTNGDKFKQHGEGYVKESVSKAIKKILKENLYNDEFYSEEDYNGNTGEPGMVKSYDIGTYYLSQAEEDAKENGYDDVAEYLDYWFNEIKQECPWYWQKIGSGYGYNGNTIFKNGQVVCKDIFDQIIIDEYPLGGI